MTITDLVFFKAEGVNLKLIIYIEDYLIRKEDEKGQRGRGRVSQYECV